VTIFRFSKKETISYSDLQYIQKSIASMVISTQSIYITKRYKQMLQLYKRSLGACVHMHYEQ